MRWCVFSFIYWQVYKFPVTLVDLGWITREVYEFYNRGPTAYFFFIRKAMLFTCILIKKTTRHYNISVKIDIWLKVVHDRVLFFTLNTSSDWSFYDEKVSTCWTCVQKSPVYPFNPVIENKDIQIINRLCFFQKTLIFWIQIRNDELLY